MVLLCVVCSDVFSPKTNCTYCATKPSPSAPSCTLRFAYLSATAQHVRAKLPNHIAARIVIAHHQHLALARLRHADAQLGARTPHHLRKVAGPKGALRLHAKCVLAHLIVPAAAHVPGVRLRIAIGRPQTVDVLAQLRVRPIGEAILARQRLGPVLGGAAQCGAQSACECELMWIWPVCRISVAIAIQLTSTPVHRAYAGIRCDGAALLRRIGPDPLRVSSPPSTSSPTVAVGAVAPSNRRLPWIRSWFSVC